MIVISRFIWERSAFKLTQNCWQDSVPPGCGLRTSDLLWLLAGDLPQFLVVFSSVWSLSHVRLFMIPWTAAHQASLSITNSQSLLKLMSIELVMPFNHLIFCCPLLFLPSILPSIRVFSNESALPIRCPKYWSFSFSISPSNGYSGLISFRMGWFDLLAVQGTLKSLLQHHSSKGSILWYSAFFYNPTLTFIHDYWKNHSFDWMEIFWYSNVSAF